MCLCFQLSHINADRKWCWYDSHSFFVIFLRLFFSTKNWWQPGQWAPPFLVKLLQIFHGKLKETTARKAVLYLGKMHDTHDTGRIVKINSVSQWSICLQKRPRYDWSRHLMRGLPSLFSTHRKEKGPPWIFCVGCTNLFCLLTSNVQGKKHKKWTESS